MEKNKPDYYNDLDKVYLKIWELLNLGLQNRDFPFHIPVFICGKRNNFDGRIVVLRGVDQKEKKVWFHSDIRSNKVKILKINPEANLLFYDKNEKVQLRISGISKINYQNHICKKSWEKTAHMSRQCYLGDRAPGKNVSIPTSGLTTDVDNLKYTKEESEIGYKNFCVVEVIFKLNYEMVYKLKKENPNLEIIINGGITKIEEIKNHLKICNGVMIGRAIYQNPYFLVDIEREIFNTHENPTREEVAENLLKYLEKEVKLGTKVNHIMRHTVGLYHGQIGSKNWKRYLSDNMMARDSDFQKAKHIMTIVQNNEKANQTAA